MKKLIFITLLAFSMIFNLNSQDTVQLDTINNAMTVEVKFENPTLGVTVDDQRDTEYINILTEVLTDNLQANSNLDNTLTTTNESLNDLIEIEQERKDESGLDYLSQKTNMSPERIRKAIQKHNIIHSRANFILVTMFIAMCIGYYREHQYQNRNWKYSLFKALGIVFLFLYGQKVLIGCLTYYLCQDYVEIQSIVNLIQ